MSASEHISSQFDEEDDGPYCPDCSTDIGENLEAWDYWQNERPKIRPENRIPCKGCGIK